MTTPEIKQDPPKEIKIEASDYFHKMIANYHHENYPNSAAGIFFKDLLAQCPNANGIVGLKDFTIGWAGYDLQRFSEFLNQSDFTDIKVEEIPDPSATIYLLENATADRDEQRWPKMILTRFKPEEFDPEKHVYIPVKEYHAQANQEQEPPTPTEISLGDSPFYFQRLRKSVDINNREQASQTFFAKLLTQCPNSVGIIAPKGMEFIRPGSTLESFAQWLKGDEPEVPQPTEASSFRAIEAIKKLFNLHNDEATTTEPIPEIPEGPLYRLHYAPTISTDKPMELILSLVNNDNYNPDSDVYFPTPRD